MNARNKENLRIHLGLVLAECICATAFAVELMRALSGNDLSWAYVFEWPVFGGYAVYMWHKLLTSERTEIPDESTRVETRPDDPDLVAWNAYLAEVHASDQAKEPSKRFDQRT